MKNQKADITIVGAGVVGLVTALLAAKHQMSVHLVDLKSAPSSVDGLSIQPRTIALNHATLSMLDNLNVWPFVDKTRLGFMDSMRVIDQQGEEMFIKAGQPSETLSVVIEYQHLQWALYQACLTSKKINYYFNSEIQSLYHEKKQVALRLKSDIYLESKVVVGADGANSWLCRYLQMPVLKRDYHHMACVGLATSENKLEHQALQTCDKDFILGVLPLNEANKHSIIFSCTENKMHELLNADKAMQDCLLTNAAHNQLGMMQWQTPIVSIPLIRQHLKKYYGDRVVIIGDAAHRIHPLAGQGANMGFADASTLIDCFAKAGQEKKDIGSLRVLKQFELIQKPKNALFLSVHDALKEALTDNSLFMNMTRQLGFKVLDKNPILKRLLKTAAS